MTKISLSRIRFTVGVDTSWSWLVCFASFLIQFIVLGIQNSFGTFFLEFLKEFHEGESSTAWIGSVSFGLTFMNGPLATAMCARWGSRVITCLGATLTCCGLILTSFVTSFPWLYITYGIVFGLGSSFSYFASIAGLTSFFKKHLCLAYGITLAGSGVGTPATIIGMEFLIGTYGWRCTFQISAAICALLFLCGLTYLPVDLHNEKPKTESKPLKDSNHPITKDLLLADDEKRPERPLCRVLRTLAKVFDPELFKDRAFAIWVLALGFCIFGYFIPFVFVIRIAEDIGVSGTQSTLLIAYLAINQTVFKVLFGRVGDFARSKRIITLQVLLFIQAIATMLCPLATKYGYVVLVVYVVLFGLGDGCWSVMLGMGTELIVGKAMMPRAFGCLYGLISIPLILGPPIAGMIFDKYGSYDAAFVLAGSTLIVGIVLMFVVQRMIGKRLDAEKEEKAIEVVLDSPDEINIVVDFDNIKGTSSTHLDKQHLVPWRRRLLQEEPCSRPSSLIISRLLDDNQSINGVLHCPSQFESFVEQGSSFDGYPVAKLLRIKNNHPEECDNDSLKDTNSIVSRNRESLVLLKREASGSINSDSGRSIGSEGCIQDSDKDAQSIVSETRESLVLLNREASGSINSDSGRSTGSEETSSLTFQRPRPDSTDSDFEYDSLSLHSYGTPFTDATGTVKASSTKDIVRYIEEDIERYIEGNIYSPSCSLYSEKESGSMDDIYSNIMERALEIETIYFDIKQKCVPDFELSAKNLEESPFNWYQDIDTYRETVL